MYVSKWKDKREVLMISTKHTHSMVNTTNRREQVKVKPQAVNDYNVNMGGVDRSEQLLSYYSSQRIIIRWYEKVFLHTVELAVNNAYLVYKEAVKDQHLRILKFRDILIKKYTCYNDEVPNRSAAASNAVTSDVSQYARIEEFHSFENIGQTASKSVFLRCRVCTQLKKRKETRARCRDCPGKPPLCPAPCFAMFHGH